jgi:hypothetical protein
MSRLLSILNEPTFDTNCKTRGTQKRTGMLMTDDGNEWFRYFSLSAKLLILGIVLSLAVSIMKPHHAYAATYSNPALLNQALIAAESYAAAWDGDCYNNLSIDNHGGKIPDTRAMINGDNGNLPADYHWLDWASAAGNPDDSTIKVDSSQKNSPVSLQLNDATFSCWTLVGNANGNPDTLVTANAYTNDQPPNSDSDGIWSDSLYDRILYIRPGSVTASGGASVPDSSPIQQVNAVDTPRDNNSRYWFSSPTGFTLNPPPGGFVSGATYTITIPGQIITVYHQTVAGGGTVQCLTPSGSLITLGNTGNVQTINYSACAFTNPPITVNISVTVSQPQNNPPVGNLDAATCSAVTGWAYDPDVPSGSIVVDVYYNGEDQQRVSANLPRNDVDAAFGITGNHGFSVTPPADVQNSTSPYTVSVYAEDAQTGTQYQIGGSPKTIGPCSTPVNNCPPFMAEGYNDTSNVPVALPETIPANSGAPTGSYGIGGGVQYTYSVNSPATTVTNVVDSNPSTETSGAVSAPVNGSPTANPVDLNYTDYFNTYAYDNNMPIVDYVLHYTKTTQPYSYSGAPVYSYPCTMHSTTSPYPCTEYGKVFLGNSLVFGTPSSTTVNQTDMQPGPLMPECFPRTYNLQPNDGTVGWTNGNDEDPNGITYYGSVTVAFGESNSRHQTAVRSGYSVNNISTTVAITVEHQADSSSNETASSFTVPCTPSVTTGLTSNNPAYSAITNAPSWNNANYTLPTMTCSEQGGGSIIPPLVYGDRVCVELSTNPSEGDMDEFGNQVATPDGLLAPNVGERQQPDGLPTSNTASPSYCTTFTAAKPYVKVFGGDTAAGASSTNTDLTYTTHADIDTYSNGEAPYSGSGSSLAAIATGDISGFASDQTLLAALTAAHNLTFANTTGAGDSTYGGGFSLDGSSASTRYYDQAVTSQGSPVPNGGLSAAMAAGVLSNGVSYFKDNMGTSGGIFNGGAPLVLTAGEHLTVYSAGPIVIDSPITISTAGVTDAAEMPTIMVVSQGGINIANSVSNLAGNYIAENSTIDDCYDTSTNAPVNPSNYFYDPTSSTPLNQTCGLKLTVEGSLLANDVMLDRTGGAVAGSPSTIHLASPTETAGNAPNAAEEFDYSALDWLVPTENNTPTVQSITSLPPIL